MLTLYLLNSDLCKFSRYNLRYATIVNRLIDVSLIRIFFHDLLIKKKIGNADKGLINAVNSLMHFNFSRIHALYIYSLLWLAKIPPFKFEGN